MPVQDVHTWDFLCLIDMMTSAWINVHMIIGKPGKNHTCCWLEFSMSSAQQDGVVSSS